MRKRLTLLLLLLAALILAALAWRYRSRIADFARMAFYQYSLRDAPAPTTIPLAVTAEPLRSDNLLPPQDFIALPPGFAITVFASGLSSPRMLALGPDGAIYAAERGAGRVARFPDRDADGLADGVETVASGLNNPTSLAFYADGSLYVAETEQVLRFSQPDAAGVFQQREVIIPNLPPGGNHKTRTIVFSPDFSALYVSIGSTCNVCIEEDERYATVMRYNPDGSGGQVYASGLRNAVGLAIRPGTSELWASNNGRDMLGDEMPPETIYRLQAGSDYGWPRCHSGRILDPDFGKAGDCDAAGAPAVEMQAHSAPLGITFYSGSQFPAEYRGDLFVAFHGSWNRSQPTGFKIVRIPIADDGTPGAVEDFAAGWLRPPNGSRWGRPVDVLTGAEGSLFVSDDGGGVIYRIFYASNP